MQNWKATVGLLMLFLSACTHTEKYVYFQHSQKDTLAVIADSMANYNTILQPDDIITISVSAIDPEVVKPFNSIPSVYKSQGGASAEATPQNAYLIDANGNIEFPVLGTIKIAGLNRIDATNAIKDRIKSYVNNPIVNVRLQNFKVTVLGDVVHPGVYTFDHEKVTLIEALGLAGDLNITGVRERVKLIRDIGASKKEIIIDLTKRDIFKSEAFYLQQNDIIYIEPSKSKVATTKSTAMYGSFIVAGTSLVITILNLMLR